MMMLPKKPVQKRKIATTLVTNELSDAKKLRTTLPPLDDYVPKPPPPTISERLAERVEETIKAPPPLFQNQLEIRLDEVIPANGRITFVRAENYMGSAGQKSCRLVTETQKRQEVWTAKVMANVNCLKGNKNYIAIGTNIGQGDGKLMCFSTLSGALHSHIHYESTILRLVIENHFCGVQLANNQIAVRDLKNERQVAFYKFTSGLSKTIKDATSFELSKLGHPIVFMKNGDVWFYSKRHQAWRLIQPSIDIMSSINVYLSFIQKVVPEGFIAKLGNNKTQLKSGTVESVMMGETAEEEQIELLLNALEEFDYMDEYALLASVYVSRLVARGKAQRLYDYIQVLNTLNTLPKRQSKIEKILKEIDQQLSTRPKLQQTINELPSQMKETLDLDEDGLAFLNDFFHDE